MLLILCLIAAALILSGDSAADMFIILLGLEVLVYIISLAKV